MITGCKYIITKDNLNASDLELYNILYKFKFKIECWYHKPSKNSQIDCFLFIHFIQKDYNKEYILLDKLEQEYVISYHYRGINKSELKTNNTKELIRFIGKYEPTLVRSEKLKNIL